MENQPYVIVCTSSRPWRIEAGYLVSRRGGTVVLRDARMIVYYDAASLGAGGLAARGCSSRCRVGPAVQEATIRGVESVHVATELARLSIEAEPWG